MDGVCHDGMFLPHKPCLLGISVLDMQIDTAIWRRHKIRFIGSYNSLADGRFGTICTYEKISCGSGVILEGDGDCVLAIIVCNFLEGFAILRYYRN